MRARRRPDHTRPPTLLRTESTGAGHPAHLVQFYEADTFLADSVGRFVGDGFDAGERVVVIALRPHLALVEQQLAGQGIDLAAARAAGRYVGLDAEQTLARLLAHGEPGDAPFADALLGLVAGAAAASGVPVRVFGEMVAVLSERGDGRRALRVEAVWNDLIATHPISLLCAYPMRAFGRAADEAPFLEICGTHGAVLPAESYVDGASADGPSLAERDDEKRSSAYFRC